MEDFGVRRRGGRGKEWEGYKKIVWEGLTMAYGLRYISGKRDSMSKTVVCFVFNSPMLIPWKVVSGVSEQDMLETILLWQESKQGGNRFRENDEVADVNNVYQKMVVRRIIRKKVMVGEEVRHQIVGIECYWWQEMMQGIPQTFTGRRVPGATEDYSSGDVSLEDRVVSIHD